MGVGPRTSPSIAREFPDWREKGGGLLSAVEIAGESGKSSLPRARGSVEGDSYSNLGGA